MFNIFSFVKKNISKRIKIVWYFKNYSFSWIFINVYIYINLWIFFFCYVFLIYSLSDLKFRFVKYIWNIKEI